MALSLCRAAMVCPAVPGAGSHVPFACVFLRTSGLAGGAGRTAHEWLQCAERISWGQDNVRFV